ncbi:yteA family sporulation protein [Clostridium fermenticellae]|uniref:YteA family sporulation protein n=1 Tax=Clostridium fermenticellae TaxID=2068654 RepID=A0A386H4J0_9CLOT|nr:TraR/DksA C4-type zinc finger protein [Clostridium fermenticellae]AYD40622.1 yteA family sporulation protein [Clostridium fermenticellae]
MDDRLLKEFKNRLEKQKDSTCNLLEQMEENKTIKSNIEAESELSLYDNHGADTAGMLYDRQRGMALQKNETAMISKIDNALSSIEAGTYGVCKRCGKEISLDRLRAVPYAEYCIHCQEVIDDAKPSENNNRPPEEDVLEDTMNNVDDSNNQVEFDMEDSYDSVGMFNRRKNITEECTDEVEEYTDPLDAISNSEYKNQLP